VLYHIERCSGFFISRLIFSGQGREQAEEWAAKKHKARRFDLSQKMQVSNDFEKSVFSLLDGVHNVEFFDEF
jgi:hypothetical protein